MNLLDSSLRFFGSSGLLSQPLDSPQLAGKIVLGSRVSESSGGLSLRCYKTGGPWLVWFIEVLIHLMSEDRGVFSPYQMCWERANSYCQVRLDSLIFQEL